VRAGLLEVVFRFPERRTKMSDVAFLPNHPTAAELCRDFVSRLTDAQLEALVRGNRRPDSI
jgi:hypothetical protein